MVKISIRTKIHIFYCFIFPLTIVGWVVLILSLSWSITQLTTHSSCITDDSTEHVRGYCQQLITGAMFNITLSVLSIGYCVVSYPFIWYLINVVTTSGILTRDIGYREPAEPSYRESLLPSYATATMTRDRVEMSRSMLQDESMVADGYSMRN